MPKYLVTCMRKAHSHAVFTFVVETENITEAAIQAADRIKRVTLFEVKTVMIERVTHKEV